MSDSFQKKHQCEICNKVFRAKKTLKDHLMIHDGTKPLKWLTFSVFIYF